MANEKRDPRAKAINWATASAEILAKFGAPLTAAEFHEIAELLGRGVPDKVLEAIEELRVAGKEGRITGINWYRPDDEITVPRHDHRSPHEQRDCTECSVAGAYVQAPVALGSIMYLQVSIDVSKKAPAADEVAPS